jgi:hypothetical protein
MDRNAEIETDTDVLKRIVALLFSFAELAHRASVRSYPVRCLVLWFLRRAEVFARDWIASGSADDMPSALSACAVLHRNSRAEAMHLARSFRVLAHTLRRQLRQEERFARRFAAGLEPALQTLGSSPLWAEVAQRAGEGSSYAMALPVAGAIRCLGEAAPRLDTS